MDNIDNIINFPVGHRQLCGRRQRTSALLRAESIGEKFNGLEDANERYKAFNALRDFRDEFGISEGALNLLDLYISFSQPQDWEAGQKPIVWLSIERACEELKKSRSRIKAYENELVAHGLLSFKDTPSSRRYGRRAQAGTKYIIEAFGVDLSPFATKATIIIKRGQDYASKRALLKQTRVDIKMHRKALSGLLSALIGEGVMTEAEVAAYKETRAYTENYYARYSSLLQDGLNSILSGLKEMIIALEVQLMDASMARDNVRTLDKTNGYPITDDTRKYIYRNNLNLSKSNAQEDVVGQTSEKITDEGTGRDDKDGVRTLWRELEPETKVSGAQVLKILRAFAPELLAIKRYETWGDLAQNVPDWLEILQINKNVHVRAWAKLGARGAIVALAVVAAKHALREINGSPGAYLNGMLNAAVKEELHLAPSVHGLIARAKNGEGPDGAGPDNSWQNAG